MLYRGFEGVGLGAHYAPKLGMLSSSALVSHLSCSPKLPIMLSSFEVVLLSYQGYTLKNITLGLTPTTEY